MACSTSITSTTIRLKHFALIMFLALLAFICTLRDVLAEHNSSQQSVATVVVVNNDTNRQDSISNNYDNNNNNNDNNNINYYTNDPNLPTDKLFATIKLNELIRELNSSLQESLIKQQLHKAAAIISTSSTPLVAASTPKATIIQQQQDGPHQSKSSLSPHQNDTKNNNDNNNNMLERSKINAGSSASPNEPADHVSTSSQINKSKSTGSPPQLRPPPSLISPYTTNFHLENSPMNGIFASNDSSKSGLSATESVANESLNLIDTIQRLHNLSNRVTRSKPPQGHQDGEQLNQNNYLFNGSNVISENTSNWPANLELGPISSINSLRGPSIPNNRLLTSNHHHSTKSNLSNGISNQSQKPKKILVHLKQPMNGRHQIAANVDRLRQLGPYKVSTIQRTIDNNSASPSIRNNPITNSHSNPIQYQHGVQSIGKLAATRPQTSNVAASSKPNNSQQQMQPTRSKGKSQIFKTVYSFPSSSASNSLLNKQQQQQQHTRRSKYNEDDLEGSAGNQFESPSPSSKGITRIVHHLHHVDSRTFPRSPPNPLVSAVSEIIHQRKPVELNADDHKRSFYYTHLPHAPQSSDHNHLYDQDADNTVAAAAAAAANPFDLMDSGSQESIGAHSHYGLASGTYGDQLEDDNSGELFDSSQSSSAHSIIGGGFNGSPWYDETNRLTMQAIEAIANEDWHEDHQHQQKQHQHQHQHHGNLLNPSLAADLQRFTSSHQSDHQHNHHVLPAPSLSQSHWFGDSSASSSPIHELISGTAGATGSSSGSSESFSSSLSPLGKYRWALARMPDLDPIPLAATVPGYLIRLPNGQIVAAAMTNSVSIQGIQKSLLGKNYKFKNNRMMNPFSTVNKLPTSDSTFSGVANGGVTSFMVNNLSNQLDTNYATDPTNIIPDVASNDNSLTQTIMSRLMAASRQSSSSGGNGGGSSGGSNNIQNINNRDLSIEPANIDHSQPISASNGPIVDNEPIFSFMDESQLGDNSASILSPIHRHHNHQLDSSHRDMMLTQLSQTLKTAIKAPSTSPFSSHGTSQSDNKFIADSLGSRLAMSLGYLDIPELMEGNSNVSDNQQDTGDLNSSTLYSLNDEASTTGASGDLHKPALRPIPSSSWGQGRRRVMPTLSFSNALKVRDWIMPYTFRPIYLSKYYNSINSAAGANRRPNFNKRDLVTINDQLEQQHITDGGVGKRPAQTLRDLILHDHHQQTTHIVAYPTYDLIYPSRPSQPPFKKSSLFSRGSFLNRSSVGGGGGVDSSVVRRRREEPIISYPSFLRSYNKPQETARPSSVSSILETLFTKPLYKVAASLWSSLQHSSRSPPSSDGGKNPG